MESRLISSRGAHIFTLETHTTINERFSLHFNAGGQTKRRGLCAASGTSYYNPSPRVRFPGHIIYPRDLPTAVLPDLYNSRVLGSQNRISGE